MVALAWEIYVPPAGATAHYSTQPPLPDWYMPIEIARDLGESFFDMERLPRDEYTVDTVKAWALIKREADNRARKLWDAHHRRKSKNG